MGGSRQDAAHDPDPTRPDSPVDQDDAPTKLDRPSLPSTSGAEPAASQSHATPGPTGASVGSAASRSTHATPAQTLHQEEIHRTPVFLRIAIGLSIAVGGATFFIGGDPIAKAVLLAGLATAGVGSAWFAWELRDDARYTLGRLLVACYACVAGALSALYYFGVFSPAAVVIPFGLYFFGLSQSFRASLSVFLVCSGFYAALGFGVLSGVLEDRGLVQGAALSTFDKSIVIVLVEVVFAATFAIARATRRANLKAIEQHDRMVRRLAQREALLREARHDLELAMRAGGVGRYTDETVGSFRLGKLIGRGGIGEVYEARHLETGDEAAVKLLQPQYLADPGHLRRFLREAKIAGSLDVPHVVRILDVGDVEAPTPYIAMERLRGCDLADHLREHQRLSVGELVEMVRQVARGLEAARAAGIVHRDLKPHNLYHAEIGGGRRIWKILDFGVSKLAGTQGGCRRPFNPIIPPRPTRPGGILRALAPVSCAAVGIRATDATMGAGRNRRFRFALGAALVGSLYLPLWAHAQELSAQERQAAAEAAYDRGSSAFRGGDYDSAARWYETANELAPSANALIQAMRSHDQAGHDLRAATLALELLDRYGQDRMGEYAQPIVDRVAPTAVRVDVTCDGCFLVVNGEAEPRHSFFLRADTEHLILARFDTGEVEERLMGGPGETLDLSIDAPEPEPQVTEPELEPGSESGTETGTGVELSVGGGRGRDVDGGGGISPAFAIIGGVLTIGAGAALTWSGLDTLDAAEEFEQMPTREKLEAGRDLEMRTNILIGATAGLGALTIAFLLLTDWGGDDGGTEAALVPLPEGGLALSARGSLP